MRSGWLKIAVFLMVVVFAFSGCANKWITSGKIAMGGKDYDKAISDFMKALEDNPDNPEAHYYLAECYREKGDYVKMLPHLEVAERLYPKKAKRMEELRLETWTKLFESGKEKAKAEKWEASRDDFEMAITVSPERYEAYINAGYVWENMGNNDSALYYFSKAYEIAPEDMVVLENYSSLCFNLEKFDLAENLYKTILSKDPKHAEAMARLGDICGEKGEHQAAVDYYNRALEQEQDNCNLWFNLGVLYFSDLKDNSNAINAFTRAVELCPEDVNAFINLSIALIMAERFEEAAERLGVFVENHPDDCTGWDLYSQALLRQGLSKQAREAYKKYEECSGK